MPEAPSAAPGLLEYIRALWAPLWTLAGGFLVLLFLRWMAPVLALAIESDWVGAKHEYLRLRLKLENRSRIPAQVTECKVQLLEHQPGDAKRLSEWVPFDAGTIKPNEAPVAWAAPEVVENPPEHLYPGEGVTIELLYRFSHQGMVLHAGFQVSQRLPRWRRWLAGQPLIWQQTTSAWIVKGDHEEAA